MIEVSAWSASFSDKVKFEEHEEHWKLSKDIFTMWHFSTWHNWLRWQFIYFYYENSISRGFAKTWKTHLKINKFSSTDLVAWSSWNAFIQLSTFVWINLVAWNSWYAFCSLIKMNFDRLEWIKLLVVFFLRIWKWALTDFLKCLSLKRNFIWTHVQ